MTWHELIAAQSAFMCHDRISFRQNGVFLSFENGYFFCIQTYWSQKVWYPGRWKLVEIFFNIFSSKTFFFSTVTLTVSPWEVMQIVIRWGVNICQWPWGYFMDPLRLLHSQDGRPQKFTSHVIWPIIDFWLILSIFRVIFCQFWSANPG